VSEEIEFIYTKTSPSGGSSQAETTLIRLRIDVDYPYPSRIRSFIYTAFGLRVGKEYLANSKIIAKMINESEKEIMAFWFFTPKTIPDNALLELLGKGKHEVALHIVNDPVKELALLEDTTGRKVRYYTIHGIDRFLGRLVWKRWKASPPGIPTEYPLQSFYRFPHLGLDVVCYVFPAEQALNIALSQIEKGVMLHIHPMWLFQRGKINQRGPYFETLRRILDVEEELNSLSVDRRLFFRVARNAREYETDAGPTAEFIEILKGKGIDLFTFLERSWCHTILNPPQTWVRSADNVGLIQITSYDEWLARVGKKTRNMIRKAEKSGISVTVAEPDAGLAEGIWKIYNETPIRQERGFPHYGVSLPQVMKEVHSAQNCTYIGAHLKGELVGFVQLVHGENIEIMSQILSLQRHWDRAVNNALVAKVIEFCAARGARWIMYGRMGNHPSLDNFKRSNGFAQVQINRYYIPITRKGKTAAMLGLHKPVKDALPKTVKYPLFPLYNWVSRVRARARLRFRPRITQ
jgi:hypothetical protein